MKSGESSILRADVLHLRQAMEQRDQEANQKLAVLKKHSDDVEVGSRQPFLFKSFGEFPLLFFVFFVSNHTDAF